MHLCSNTLIGPHKIGGPVYAVWGNIQKLSGASQKLWEFHLSWYKFTLRQNHGARVSRSKSSPTRPKTLISFNALNSVLSLELMREKLYSKAENLTQKTKRI
jgi:hypothetical protein